jgi:hypothetical protein
MKLLHTWFGLLLQLSNIMVTLAKMGERLLSDNTIKNIFNCRRLEILERELHCHFKLS